MIRTIVLLGLGSLAACHVAATSGDNDAGATGGRGPTTGTGGGGPGSGGTPGTPDGGGSGGSPNVCNPPCTDFPPDPIIVTGVPATVPGMFGAAGSSTAGAAAPCLLDPQDGTMFPANWLRPRIRFQPAPGQTQFEIRVKSDRQKNQLVVYTNQPSWTMPKDVWARVVEHQGGEPLLVTVRSLSTTGGTTSIGISAPSSFTIAPVAATGSIVYWTTSGVSALKGFKAGDEAVMPVLTPAMVGTEVKCIGCHVSTPDGQFIGLAANPAVYNADPASLAIRSGTTMREPMFLTAAARQLLGRSYQPLVAFSAGHWKNGDHVALSVLQNTNIVWTDLEATSMAENTGWGIIARTGDTGRPVAPTWSRDGKTIVYSSVSGTTDTGLRILGGVGKLYTVPYNDRKGGEAKPLPGGGGDGFHGYYAAFSPEDQYIAFNRAPSAGTSYDEPAAELFIVPREGAATPTRLAANDPPACANRPSPGVTNSWAKWAPSVNNANGTWYFWLTFSSRRMPARNPQIFITSITVDKAGAVKTYPALHLWNQPETESNHTPAWDNFEIIVQ